MGGKTGGDDDTRPSVVKDSVPDGQLELDFEDEGDKKSDDPQTTVEK